MESGFSPSSKRRELRVWISTRIIMYGRAVVHCTVSSIILHIDCKVHILSWLHLVAPPRINISRGKRVSSIPKEGQRSEIEQP